ncbi:hypothetical protein Peur_048810 [Populus x canadensis]
MWNQLSVPSCTLYAWDSKSTCIHEPPDFKSMTMSPPGPHGVKDACRLLNFGDSITTHHISPAGSIHRDSPAARYLMERGVIWRRRKRKNSSMKRRWRMMFSLLVLSQAHELELRLPMLSYFLKNSQQTTPTKGLGWETRDYSRYK